MRTHVLMRNVILPLAIIIALTAAPAAIAKAAQTSAEVQVTITVLPFAEVTLDPSVIVTLPEGGGNSQPVFVSGTVTANISVMLFSDIVPPAGAPGNWYATLMVVAVDQPGVHILNPFVRIVVLNVPAGHGGNIELNVLGSKLGNSPTVQAGQVVITVMQM